MKKLLFLFEESYSQYKSSKRKNKQRRYAQSVARKALGGKNYFRSKKEEREERQRKKRERRNRIGASLSQWRNWFWKEMWENFSQAQKEQFINWFEKRTFQQFQEEKREWTVWQALYHVNKRIDAITNKYFVKRQALTKQQWDFVYALSELFGDAKLSNSLTTTNQKERVGKRLAWRYPKQKSSWIIKFKYEGETKSHSKGILRVVMKRGKLVYPFFDFPFVEYVMLTHVRGSIGTYWWKQWLWRYSRNPNKFAKFGYSGRREQFDKFLRSK